MELAHKLSRTLVEKYCRENKLELIISCLSVTGPVHNPTHKYLCQVGDFKIEKEATTKKAAVELCCRELLVLLPPCKNDPVNSLLSCVLDLLISKYTTTRLEALTYEEISVTGDTVAFVVCPIDDCNQDNFAHYIKTNEHPDLLDLLELIAYYKAIDTVSFSRILKSLNQLSIRYKIKAKLHIEEGVNQVVYTIYKLS